MKISFKEASLIRQIIRDCLFTFKFSLHSMKYLIYSETQLPMFMISDKTCRDAIKHTCHGCSNIKRALLVVSVEELGPRLNEIWTENLMKKQLYKTGQFINSMSKICISFR